MTSTEIRQSFLDFFKSKEHTIVPSSSLMPDSPNLLFTNAGMNQFVPIFLGQNKCPYAPGRAADTQKCIRAGGKHNDLDDVGLDTYHHTFFEMLGNWSFGDYFKKEAIEWAWELVVGRWKFPANRLYATVYSPDKSKGDPSEFDQEAWNFWAEKFRAAGLDPAVHIVNGNKKDNFWMMGDTGPCGPCSELHVDLTPAGDTRGRLVNQGVPECIEIWNLVFIQFNAQPVAGDGGPGGAGSATEFVPLTARHVDTGMGFERVASIIQGTKNFTDFANAKISNYETDIFRPIFDEIEKLSGKKYTSTLPGAPTSSRLDDETGRQNVGAPSAQNQIDIAFRVIADHIRTLSFAIADGIQPGNTDRNYVLRRILRRAVRYGRTLGFHEPFFYKLVDVLARTMGDVFPEIRAKQAHVETLLKTEEEAFNKTLDKGIALFEAEVVRLTGAQRAQGSARAPRAVVGAPANDFQKPTAKGALYSKRRLPHFERPWSKYFITFSTQDRRSLSPDERDIVLQSLLHAHEHRQYALYAACVMPDHVHLLCEPQIKGSGDKGEPIFFSLSEILQGIKSTTAHRINKAVGKHGSLWDKESFDRLIRSESDLEEKFLYICRNPWDSGIVGESEDYAWLWTPDASSARAPKTARGGACAPLSQPEAERPVISGAFAFRLYDEQGFPLDLTELMARERGLTVDVAGFEKLMEEQRERARKAQKKEVITVSDDNLQLAPTQFLGYDFLETEAVVEAVIPATGTGGSGCNEWNLVLDRTACYAEMGGQVGDTGLVHVPGHDRSEAGRLQVLNTAKKGDVFIHRAKLADGRAPEPGEAVRVAVDAGRRAAIQRHHTVTHLLHWALHEVVSRDATQKGSFVGPDKLTFDFNSAALTPAQIRDVERLVNERIVENAGVTWTEMPYSGVKSHPGIMQFFGDKYGDVVRVVQIGGHAGALDGYSMELCGGTHTRATGEIGLFRIVAESAIAAGVRRIEAVAGLNAWEIADAEKERLKTVAAKLNAPFAEVEKKLDALLAEQKELEKSLKAARQREAASRAGNLLEKQQAIGATPAIVENLGETSGDELQAVVDALKSKFKGVVVLGGVSGGTVALAAAVSPDFVSKIQAGKIIQTIAPLVGGKGGGRPDNARGAGKDPAKIDEALARAKSLIASQ